VGRAISIGCLQCEHHLPGTVECKAFVGNGFEGVENFREWRRIYPAKVKFEIRRILGNGNLWVVETSISYDDGPWNYGVCILEFRGDKVAHETIYVTQGWDAPEWRAPWRARRERNG
jgi:hypothetical protein